MKNLKLLLFVPLMLLTTGTTNKSNISSENRSFGQIKRAIYNDGLGDIHYFPATNHNNLLKSSDVVSSAVENNFIRFDIDTYCKNYLGQGQSLIFITNANVNGQDWDENLGGGLLTVENKDASKFYDGNDHLYERTYNGTFDLDGYHYNYFYIDYSNSFKNFTYDYCIIDLIYHFNSGYTNEYYLFECTDDYGEIVPSMFLEGKKDVKGPLISGSNVSYFTNVETPISVATIKSKLTATDETDGDVSSSIKIVEDNYTGHEKELGAHIVKFEASDTSGNKSYLTVTINVKDVTAPVITGPETMTYSYDQLISEDSFLLNYSVTDNVDTATRLTTTYSTNIFDKQNSIGTYSVKVKATDSSGNETTKTVQVIIEDKKAPVITGPETITKRTSVTLTTEEILKQFSANDEYDGSCAVYVVEDNYTGNGDKKGKYTIKIGAKDKSNNVGIKTLTIDVIDDIAPVWYVDQSLIYVDASVTLTQQDIINLMVQSGEITNDYSIVQISAAEYLETPNKAGTYKARVLVKYSNGKQVETEKTIEVVDDSGSIKVEKKNFWDKICDFFKMIYDKVLAPIGRFFKNLWNKIFH